MVMLASFPAASTALMVCSVSAGETVSVPSAVSDTGVPFTVTCTRFASLIVSVGASQYVFLSSTPLITGAV